MFRHPNMPVLLLIISLLFSCSLAKAEEEYRKVKVAEPFIELHTGPGRGYPVFYVIDRNEWIEIVKRRTDWFKIISADGTTGWTHQQQLELTLDPEGQKTQFAEITQAQFAQRDAEVGVMGGDMNGAQTVTLYGAYNFTANISAELSFMQAIGSFSNNLITNVNLLHQAFPEWRYSPFFALGIGNIKTTPRATLVQAEDRSDLLAHVGIGTYAYISRSFALRAEYNRYVVFSSDDDNEDIKEWKVGLVTFF